MSESEQKGRCRSEVDECRGSPSELKIADAIDRLAADVASIKAKIDAVAPEDVRHFVESEKAFAELFAEQRDAAIRERDAARAEVERLKAIVHSDAGHMAKILIENERLRAAPAAAQPAGQGISPGLPETQPTGNAAPPAGWLTNEERGVIVCAASELSAIGHHRPPDKEECLRLSAALRSVVKRHDENTPARAGSPPEQTAAGWLTAEERRALSRAVHLLFSDDCDTPSAGTIQALLSRAGSPPVVEVPALGFLGDMTGREQGIVLAYRDALDAVGVKWKEVGRE